MSAQSLGTGVASLAAVLSAVVAWIAIRATSRNLQAQFVHERQVQNESRLWERRASSYVNWINVLAVWQLVHHGKADIDDALREQLAKAFAEVALYGSEEAKRQATVDLGLVLSGKNQHEFSLVTEGMRQELGTIRLK